MSGAIKTIANMVLISMQPFAGRKILLLAVAVLCLSSAFCFADSVFMARRYAPSKHDHRGEINLMVPTDTVTVSPAVGVDPEIVTRTTSTVIRPFVCLRRPMGFTLVRTIDRPDWPGFFFLETNSQSL